MTGKAASGVTPPRDGWGLSEAEFELGERVYRDALIEIHRRFARPVVGIREKNRRLIRLWDTVEIDIGASGRGLFARYVDGTPDTRIPWLSLDLKHPIGREAWLGCFTPLVARICKRNGLAGQAQRWIRFSLRAAIDPAFDFQAQRAPVLAFLAPDPLARSLANRIFDGKPDAEEFNRVCQHAAAIALVGVEHPAMLPFLRLVLDGEPMNPMGDPLAALERRLIDLGMERAAWKKLPCWTFAAFEKIRDDWPMNMGVPDFANLLLRLDVHAPPPPTFATYAIAAGLHGQEGDAPLDFDRLPTWFMRSLLRESERPREPAEVGAFRDELDHCLDWLLAMEPEPDANQQRAGWAWIREQALEWRKAHAVARVPPWSLPCGEMTCGPYRVVPIGSMADLIEEADAMKNCLDTYAAACRAGNVIVFSIRERSSGRRVACFALGRNEGVPGWELIQVAGKMNAAAGPGMEAIARAVMGRVNKLNPGPSRQKPRPG